LFVFKAEDGIRDRSVTGVQTCALPILSFRVADHKAIKAWEEKYNQLEMRHSGLVDRFYFEALYTRVGHILIEVSTDGPGFIDERSEEHRVVKVGRTLGRLE